MILPPGSAGVPPACTPVTCPSVPCDTAPGKPARDPRAARTMGDGPTWERGRPARTHPRYVPLSFPAIRHPASQCATLDQQERWEMVPPGSAGVPPACTPVTCPSVSLRYGTRQASARPSSNKSDGTWAHLGARASRPHAPPLRAAQFPCDVAPGHPAGRNGMGSVEAESWPRCRSIQVEKMAEAVPGLVRAGDPHSRADFIP